MNKQQLFLQAKRTIDERRFAAEEKAARTLETLRSNDDWRNTEHALRSVQVDIAMGNGNKTQLEKQLATLQQKQAQLLKESGVLPQQLVPQYHCKLCNDQGYVDGKTCRCLQEEVRKLIISGGNVFNAQFTFENSTETDAKNLAVAAKIRQIVRDGVENVLLVGKVGTGKTYLLTAAANLAAQLEKSVLFVTAYSLNADFLSAYLDGAESVNALVDSLVDVDLLLVDDLGTEKLFNNVTVNLLFTVLNERIVNKKQTMFSSNLTLKDIRDRYDERIVSRLVDKHTAFVAQLVGADKRV